MGIAETARFESNRNRNTSPASHHTAVYAAREPDVCPSKIPVSRVQQHVRDGVQIKSVRCLQAASAAESNTKNSKTAIT